MHCLVASPPVEGHQSNGVTMDVSSHPRPSSLLLGGNQTNYLVCEVHFPTINRFGDVTNWTREGAPLLVKNGTAIQWLEIITEDPFCDPTVNDSVSTLLVLCVQTVLLNVPTRGIRYLLPRKVYLLSWRNA